MTININFVILTFMNSLCIVFYFLYYKLEKVIFTCCCESLIFFALVLDAPEVFKARLDVQFEQFGAVRGVPAYRMGDWN